MCNVRGNKIDVDSAKLLAKVATQKRVMLFGIEHDQQKADFSRQSLGPADAILIASDVSVSGALTSLDMRRNDISGEAAQQLAAAALGSASLEVFGGVPIKQLRADALTDLDLNYKSIGPTEAIVLAKLVEVSGALSHLNLKNNGLGEDGKRALNEANAKRTTPARLEF